MEKMLEVIEKPRTELSPYAPRIITTSIDPEKIRDVIGPGGKTIKKIIDETGVKIDIEDDGKVFIAAIDVEAAKKALKLIENLTKELEVGQIYLGKVMRITNFGAFVEVLPGKEGLVHISQLALERVEKVEDIVSVGDEILVKVVDAVKTSLRKSDFFFRWGGDEFILLLPNTDINGAEILTNKLRKIINQIEVGGIKVSASFGVIEFKGAEIDKESLFKKLDEALYKAKQLGKNRIFVIK